MFSALGPVGSAENKTLSAKASERNGCQSLGRSSVLFGSLSYQGLTENCRESFFRAVGGVRANGAVVV